MKKTIPISDVKELLRDILEFAGGVDSELSEYITEQIKSL